MSEALPPGHFLFASEAVVEGCPDKLCDRVADAVLDACLAQDAQARVSCDACTKSSMVMILGEVVSKASVNYEQVIRDAVKAVGYDSDDKGLDWRTMNVIVALDEQSPDFSQAVIGARGADEVTGREQGIVVGYATDETPELLPMSHALATALCVRLDKVRKEGALPWAKPGGSAQVVMEYLEGQDGSIMPKAVRSVQLLVPRAAAGVAPEQAEKDLMANVVRPVLPEALCNSNTEYRFGDARAEVGMSGRRGMSDMYGGWCPSASGSLSGRDGTKVSRSAAYGARWAAQSLVAAKLCRRATVQLGYVVGSAEPTSISVNSHGSSRVSGRSDADLAALLRRFFDFRPASLARDLGLQEPRFQQFSAYGHFGRTDVEAPWEKPKEIR